MAAVLENFAALLLLIQVASSACPSGWGRFQDSCYMVVTTNNGIWQNALNYCVGLGSHLVEVQSEEENIYIKKELTTLHPGIEDQFWMAGSDAKHENMWVWVNSGDSFEVTDWYPGEPNQNGGDENCLTYYTRFDFKWNDEHCDRHFPFICEKEDPTGNPGTVVG